MYNIIVTTTWCESLGIHQYVIDVLEKHDLFNKSLTYILDYCQSLEFNGTIVIDELTTFSNLLLTHPIVTYDGNQRVITIEHSRLDTLLFEWKGNNLIKITDLSDTPIIYRAYYDKYLTQSININNNGTYQLSVFNYDDNYNLVSHYKTPSTTLENFISNNYPTNTNSKYMTKLDTKNHKKMVTESICDLIGITPNYKRILSENDLYGQSALSLVENLRTIIHAELLHNFIIQLETGLSVLSNQEVTPILSKDNKLVRVLDNATGDVLYNNHWVNDRIVSRTDTHNREFSRLIYDKAGEVTHNLEFINDDIIVYKFNDDDLELLTIPQQPYNQPFTIH